MFKSIATALLNRILGNYIENLNRKQLKIGIWNGKVEMSNIILKLPPTLSSTYFTLIKGTIQSLSLTIPWSNISKNFSFLEITNIQITLLTGITDPYKIKKYIIEALTEKIIKSISEGISEGSRYDNNNRGTSSRDTNSNNRIDTNSNNRIDTNSNNRIDTNNTFITRIVAKILNNLQIIIKEIEIRVITLEGHIFKFKIDLIKMKSCNSKWDMIEGVSDRDMMEGGVSDTGTGVEGVSDSTNTQHPVNNLSNEQHPVSDTINEQHPVNNSTSQHPVNNSTSQHPVNNSTSQHPVNNSTNEHHPVNNSINEQHPVNNSINEQHPINNNTTHHPINNNTTQHPVNNNTTHHPVNNNTTHHPINNNTFKIIHVKGFSININNYLLFDLQIITIKCTINNKNLLFKTDIEIPNINTELTIDSYKKVIEFIHTILVEKNKNENLMIKSINSKILEIEEFIRKGGVIDKGMLEGVNNKSSVLGGVNYKDSVIEGVNNSTDVQHPLYISTDVQHPLYISTNEQHPVNNKTNKQHPVNTTPNINTHIWNLIYQIYFEKYKINTFDRNDTLNILKENEKYCDLYRKKINKKIKKEEEIELNEFENKNLIKKIINLRNEVLHEKTPKKSFFSYFWNKKVSKEDKKEIYKVIEYTDSKGSIVGEVDSKDSKGSVNALSNVDSDRNTNTYTNTNNNNLTLPTSPYLDSDSLEYVDALEPSDETYKKLTREIDNKEVDNKEVGSREICSREVDNKEVGNREVGTKEKDSKQSISKKYVCNFLVKNFNFNFKVNENIKYSISIENLESFISKEGRSIDLSLSVYNFNIFYKKYDKTYKILRNKRGVEGSTSKEEGVSNRGSKEEGVSDRGSKEKGVSDRGSKEGGVSDSTNEQRGVSDSTSKQQGVSNTTIKQ
ncbi:putative vacuolar protein-sorting protein, partial [Hamiltosporidium magnivora]